MQNRGQAFIRDATACLRTNALDLRCHSHHLQYWVFRRCDIQSSKTAVKRRESVPGWCFSIVWMHVRGFSLGRRVLPPDNEQYVSWQPQMLLQQRGESGKKPSGRVSQPAAVEWAWRACAWQPVAWCDLTTSYHLFLYLKNSNASLETLYFHVKWVISGLKGIRFYPYSLDIVLISRFLAFPINSVSSIKGVSVFHWPFKLHRVKLRGNNPSGIFSRCPLSQLFYLPSFHERLWQRLNKSRQQFPQRLLVNTCKALENPHPFLLLAPAPQLWRQTLLYWDFLWAVIVLPACAALFTHPLWQVYCMFVPPWRQINRLGGVIVKKYLF